jgi:hypothetical protein
MAYSVRLAVEALVSRKDRDALEAMREHRERVRRNMHKIDGSVFTDCDMTEIEAGLLRLQGTGAAKHNTK